jgi:hypothetical protein
LLLCAAVTIVVKKRLVNSITFLYILYAVVAWRWQHCGRGGSDGSTVAAASLAAEVATWWKRNFSSSSIVFGNAVAAWWWRQQEQCIDGSSMAYADNNFNCHDDDDD